MFVCCLLIGRFFLGGGGCRVDATHMSSYSLLENLNRTDDDKTKKGRWPRQKKKKKTNGKGSGYETCIGVPVLIGVFKNGGAGFWTKNKCVLFAFVCFFNGKLTTNNRLIFCICWNDWWSFSWQGKVAYELLRWWCRCKKRKDATEANSLS